MTHARKQKYLKIEALEQVRQSSASNTQSEKERLLREGIKSYREYLALPENHDDDDAWAGMGGAYRRLNEIDRAIESYQAAYEINSGSTYALVNLVSLLAARNLPGDLRKRNNYNAAALELFQKKIREGTADYWTWYDVATLQLIDGKVEKSFESFNYAAELTPKSKLENFRSVLSNLEFLNAHQPGMPGLTAAIDLVSGYIPPETGK